MSHETVKLAYEQFKAKLLRRIARESRSTSAPTSLNMSHAYRPLGTWEFMSLGTLKEPTKHIEIADELESMLNVLLYYSIRYLPHTCLDVGEFVHTYFDDAVPVDRHESNKYITGIFRMLFFAKCGMIAQDFSDLVFLRAPLSALPESAAPSSGNPSRRDTRSEDQPKAALPVTKPRRSAISQNDIHPIDRVLGELFPLFKALYDVRDARRSGRHPGDDSDCETDSDLVKSLKAAIQKASPVKQRARFKKRTGKSAWILQLRSLEEDAEMLKDHSGMREILDCALHELSWPADDKQADQLYAPFGAEKDADDEE